jgi:hypothetical protein
MRIRIKSLPDPGEMDEYDLRRFRPGDVYDVASKLASLLILTGHAEPVSSLFQSAEAADYSKPRKP